MSDSGIDFKDINEAWYAVRLLLQNETLTVKYIGFNEMFDGYYRATDFKNLDEIDEFEKRFRPTSKQLQDEECGRIIEGMAVCASHFFADDDVRFYDAVVEAVNFSHHEKEDCACTFLLFWEHGPNAGKKTWSGIESICQRQPGNGKLDPILTLFLKICREKIVVLQNNPKISLQGDMSENRTVACTSQEPKISKQSVCIARTFKGRINHCGRVGQDTDLGGKFCPTDNPREATNCYSILIENLEKDLSPSVIVDFINKHVSVSSQAQVFPCSPVQLYTRGVIVVASEEELQKLSNFLNDPGHVIFSSRGRPWVISEKQSWCGAVHGTFGTLMRQAENQPLDRSLEFNHKLELVKSGTVKYKKGKRLIELYMNLADHIGGLHKRLALEESKILQSSLL